MKYEKDFEDLKKFVKMETQEDVKSFDFKVWELAQSQDPEVLSKLIDIFDDECGHLEVMYSLVHAIEITPGETYVKLLIDKIKNGMNFYPFWLETLFNRIFNDPKYLEFFRSNMHFADKESLLKLFDLMEKESPHHRELIQELRQELNKSS